MPATGHLTDTPTCSRSVSARPGPARRRALGRRILIGLLAAAALALPAVPAHAATPAPYPVPIGPAPYAGDPVPAWFTEPNINVRQLPEVDSALLMRGQPEHTVVAQCWAAGLGRIPTGYTSTVWIRVIAHPTQAATTRQGWVYAPLLWLSAPVHRCPAGL